MSSRRAGTVPARASRSSLFTVAIWEALATESRGRPVARLGNSVFPGAFASDRLLVSTQTTTVLIRLALTSSRCSTSAGCRYPGLDPSGSPKSTHQTCPRRITAGPAPTPVRPPSFGVGTLLPRDDHPVPRLGRIGVTTAPCHELTRSLSQQPAARHLQLSCAGIDRCGQLVGERNGGLHRARV